jgi:hypothetical protein
MDNSFSLAANPGLIEGWLRAIGSKPTSMTVPYAAWQFEFDYPPNTPHKMIVVNPSVQPRALVVVSKVAFSQEHLTAHALMENADKARFIHDLQCSLNRESVEFGFEGQQGLLTCPAAFQVSVTRYDDGISLDGLARAVSSVYKAEFAGLLVVQDHLGSGNYGGSGGDFPFRVRIQ